MAGILLLFLAACSQEPAEIHYKSDECAHCKMMIMDERFAAQIVTSKGKAIKFDAIECMIAYSNENDLDPETAKFWVSDFNNPGNWIEATQAVYVKSEEIQSPMGASLLALESQEESQAHLDQYPGKTLSWEELPAH